MRRPIELDARERCFAASRGSRSLLFAVDPKRRRMLCWWDEHIDGSQGEPRRKRRRANSEERTGEHDDQEKAVSATWRRGAGDAARRARAGREGPDHADGLYGHLPGQLHGDRGRAVSEGFSGREGQLRAGRHVGGDARQHPRAEGRSAGRRRDHGRDDLVDRQCRKPVRQDHAGGGAVAQRALSGGARRRRRVRPGRHLRSSCSDLRYAGGDSRRWQSSPISGATISRAFCRSRRRRTSRAWR